MVFLLGRCESHFADPPLQTLWRLSGSPGSAPRPFLPALTVPTGASRSRAPWGRRRPRSRAPGRQGPRGHRPLHTPPAAREGLDRPSPPHPAVSRLFFPSSLRAEAEFSQAVGVGLGSFCILRMERKDRSFLSRCLERDVCKALGDPEKPARVRACRREGGRGLRGPRRGPGPQFRAKPEIQHPARRWLLATLITAETLAWDRLMYSSRRRAAHCLFSGGLLEGKKKKGPL